MSSCGAIVDPPRLWRTSIECFCQEGGCYFVERGGATSWGGFMERVVESVVTTPCKGGGAVSTEGSWRCCLGVGGGSWRSCCLKLGDNIDFIAAKVSSCQVVSFLIFRCDIFNKGHSSFRRRSFRCISSSLRLLTNRAE